ncbi:MAG: dCMP deaminase family protein [Euryarchaeota archaeon]|jgi:dCMP deaminase
MKQKFIDAYMDVAERFAQLSSAKRLNVGAIVVKDDRIISIGYNGMPSGWTNECEESWEWPDGHPEMRTKPEVLHAESNAIAKLARSAESGEGASIFITHSPCIECAKLIYQSGITTVYYKNEYRSTQGIDFLEKSKLNVVKI